MRLLLILSLFFLAACAPGQANVVTAEPAPTGLEMATPAAVGTWDFRMDNPEGGGALTGTLTINPDGSGRIAVPQQRIDAPVQDGALEAEGGAFTWRGRVASPMGPLGFNLRGEVNGDRMTAQNELAGVGTVALTATRQAE